MKKLLFLLLIAICGTAAARTPGFGDFFRDGTMRFDYYHCGNHAEEEYYFDELKAEPYWAGSKVSLIDTTGYGEQFFRIVDTQSGMEIYSRGFCTLFNEWQDTEEAASVRRAFPESVVFPYPKHACRIELFSRDVEGRFVKKFGQEIDPESSYIRQFRPCCETFEVVYNGNPSTHVDIVLLPEGYSETERERFEADCCNFARKFFEYSPYKENSRRFNIRAVWAPSEESGVTIPAEHIWRNTACNANFYTFGSERYLTVTDFQRLRDLAAHVPYEYIYVLSNTQKYGGGGIFNFYGISAAHHPSTTGKVYVHEFGHVLLGLGDEYVGTTAYDGRYGLKTEPWEANLTTLVDFKSKAWSRMLAAGTPVPTPDTEQYNGVTGVFEGGGYAAAGIYRPARICIMRTNQSDEFCPVCTRAIQEYIDFLCK